MNIYCEFNFSPSTKAFSTELPSPDNAPLYIELYFVTKTATHNIMQERKETIYKIYIQVRHSATLISGGYLANNSSVIIFWRSAFISRSAFDSNTFHERFSDAE